MPKPLPPIISINELEAQDIPPPVALVEGLLDRGSKLILIGSSKANKTWCLMDMAWCVAKGVPLWWGMRIIQHKVLYINFELKPYRFRERMNAIAQAHGHANCGTDAMDVWNLRGYARHHAELAAEAKKLFRTSNYGLIVVDPLYKYNSSDKVENDATDMTAVVNSLESLCVDLDTAIAFSHHSPKGDMEERDVLDRGSGSGVLTRDPDTILDIRRIKGSRDEFKAEFRFRDFPPRDPIGLRFEFPVMMLDETISLSKADDKAKDEVALLKLLPASGYRDKDWQQAALEKLSMSRATYFRYKSSLHIKDMVECESGMWVPMTPGKVGGT